MWVNEKVIQLVRPLAVTIEVSQVTAEEKCQLDKPRNDIFRKTNGQSAPSSCAKKAACQQQLRKGSQNKGYIRDLTEGDESEECSGKNGNVGYAMPISLAENLRGMSVAGHLSERAGRAVVVGIPGRVDTERNACVCVFSNETVSNVLMSPKDGNSDLTPPAATRLTDDRGEGLDLETVHRDDIRLGIREYRLVTVKVPEHRLNSPTSPLPWLRRRWHRGAHWRGATSESARERFEAIPQKPTVSCREQELRRKGPHQ